MGVADGARQISVEFKSAVEEWQRLHLLLLPGVEGQRRTSRRQAGRCLHELELTAEAELGGIAKAGATADQSLSCETTAGKTVALAATVSG